MINCFQVDCRQQPNPHISYLKIPTILKISIVTLMNQIGSCVNIWNMKDVTFMNSNFCREFVELAENVKIYLSSIKNLKNVALLYIEARFIIKFESDFLLKRDFVAALLGLLDLMIKYARNDLKLLDHINNVEIIMDAMIQIMEENILQVEFNHNENYKIAHVQLIELCHEFGELLLENSNVGMKYKDPPVFQVSFK